MCQSRAAEAEPPEAGKEEAVEEQGMCYIRQERLFLRSFPIAILVRVLNIHDSYSSCTIFRKKIYLFRLDRSQLVYSY